MNMLTLHCLYVHADPITFDEALKHEKWRLVMDKEIKSITKKNTWSLVDRPDNHRPIGIKWLIKPI